MANLFIGQISQHIYQCKLKSEHMTTYFVTQTVKKPKPKLSENPGSRNYHNLPNTKHVTDFTSCFKIPPINEDAIIKRQKISKRLLIFTLNWLFLGV